MQINELKNNIGNIVEGIFYVQDYQICSGTKSKYANVVISDATGSHTARQWEESFTGEEKKLIGKIVSITGKVNTWEGTPSLSVSVMEEAAEGTYNMSDIIKCLTSEQEKRLVGILNSYISSINDEGIKNVVKHLSTRITILLKHCRLALRCIIPSSVDCLYILLRSHL